MVSVWQTLIGNFACVALIISVWIHVSYRHYRLSKRQQNLSLGLTLGIAAAASMALSVRLEEGVIFDLRVSMIVISAVFGGPLSTLVTAAIAAIYRLYIGGAAAYLGIIGLGISVIVSLLVSVIARRKGDLSSTTLILIAVFAALMSVGVLRLLSLEMFLRLANELGLQIALANFIATASSGFALYYFKQFTLERDILRAALTQAPDYHFVKDINSRFVVTNRNVAHHHGSKKSSEMVGLSDFDLEKPERARQLFDHEQAMMKAGLPIVSLEENLDRGSEGMRWYSTSKVPLRNHQGDLIGLAGVTVDITDRKKLEQELRASKDLMAHAMAEMTDGLALFNKDGYLVFCNQQYRSLFPRSAYARFPGAHIVDIIRATTRNAERYDLPSDSSEEAILKAADALHSPKDEILRLFDDRWLRLRTRPSGDGSSLVVVSDVSLMKRSEETLRELAHQMKDLAATDALTGLANRREFDAALQREFQAAKQQGTALALLLVDIDRFKAFNDTYGHSAGDDCLRKVSAEMKAVAKRDGDLVARYGGEEFCIILPNAPLARAREIADQLRALLKALTIPHTGSESSIVTASVGVSIFGAGMSFDTPQQLIESADQALYRAKNLGRDRTEVAHGKLSIAK